MSVKVLARKPKFPLVEDGDRVCYVILHLAVPSNIYPVPSKRHLKGTASAKKAGKELGIIVWPIRLYWNDNHGTYRYFFRFPWYRRNDNQALYIAETFLCAVSLTHGPFMDANQTVSAWRVPANLVRNADNICIEQLMEVEENRDFSEKMLDFPATTLNSAIGLSDYSVDLAWQLTPTLVKIEGLYRAARMLKASHDDFYVWPGEVSDVLRTPELTATTGFEQTKLENALQNAYKAVEAILGDPPRDDRRFFAKLKAIDLDPDEAVGYVEKNSLHKVIRNMNDARDKKSAHGSTPNSKITAGELMEYQACASLIFWAAVAKTSGKSFS